MKRPYRHACAWQNPDFIANELLKTWGENGFIWLDGDSSQLGRWVIMAADPIQQICCRGLPNDRDGSNPFEVLRNIKSGHWTGWLSYEAAAWIEPNNPWKRDDMATLWIASHDPIFKFDLKKQEFWIEGYDSNRLKSTISWLEKLSTINSNKSYVRNYTNGIPMNSWQWHTSKDKYSENVSYIKNLIQSGDIFQANLAVCCTTSLPSKSSALEIFTQLRESSPAPFSGIVIAGDSENQESIISASPERFLKILANGDVEARPIKGTRPRNKDPQKDADMAIDLVSSPKDRAENIMIVDLIRNDLGRVCQPGSIHVPQLVGLESFPKVHHLTSVIKGSLRTDKTWVDVLEACWPGGSISGAPKLRACQRINEIENMPRGPYCGSLINIDWYGNFDSNILIRSIMLKNKILRVNAGCGIVADSNPQDEAEEMSWKLMPLLKALDK